MHKQLTTGQRHQIYAYLSVKLKPAEIARRLNVHRSTICNEIKRNAINGEYHPELADQLTKQRRKHATKRQISPAVIRWLHFFLIDSELYFSPEQISAELKKMGLSVSHEWIYRYIAKDRQQGGKLYKGLRNQGRPYKKRSSKKGKIPNAVSIDHRPKIVDERARIGDWEVDLVLGKQGTGAILTMVERKSYLFLLRKLPNKRAETVAKMLKTALEPYKNHVHTLTFDNGLEFAKHEEAARHLNAQTYFCHPYSSWERGLNENFNGLLRQYIPKGTDIRKIPHKRIKQIETLLNIRPRKHRNYHRPTLFFKQEITRFVDKLGGCCVWGLNGHPKKESMRAKLKMAAWSSDFLDELLFGIG